MRKLALILLALIVLAPLAASADKSEENVKKLAKFGWITEAEGLTNKTFMLNISDMEGDVTYSGNVSVKHVCNLNTSVTVVFNMTVEANATYDNRELVIYLYVSMGNVTIEWTFEGYISTEILYDVLFFHSSGIHHAIADIKMESNISATEVIMLPEAIGSYEFKDVDNETLAPIYVFGNISLYSTEEGMDMNNETLEDSLLLNQTFDLELEYELYVEVNTSLVLELEILKDGASYKNVTVDVSEGLNEISIPVDEPGNYSVSAAVKYEISKFVVKLEDIELEPDFDRDELKDSLSELYQNVTGYEEFADEFIDVVTHGLKDIVEPAFTVKGHEPFEEEKEEEEHEELEEEMRSAGIFVAQANTLTSESPYDEYSVIVALTVSVAAGEGEGGEEALPSTTIVLPLVGLFVATLAIAYAISRKNTE